MFDFESAMGFINGFDKLGKPITDLNRISALLKILDNPQDKLKYIHVAGTNGKGSVAEMCSLILIKSGYKVGTFTSPFIVEYSDRIRINGQYIPNDDLCEIALLIKEKISLLEYQSHFSQFEISTAIAFLYFAKQRCDIVVLEVGIGGKLDSTNVIKSPIVSVITSISHDHTAILGGTLEEIAAQKAGIIKKNCPCVLSADNPSEVVEVVQKTANSMHSTLVIPDIKGLKVISSDIYGSKFAYNHCSYVVTMAGRHQITNAMTVIEAMNFVRNSGFFVRQLDIERGIKNAKVFVRAEIISQEPLIIIDGAHNPAGMKALANLIKTVNYSSSVAIIGMLKDKNAVAAIKELAPCISEFICVEGFHQKEIPADELVKIIKATGRNAFAVYDLKLAFDEAKSLIDKDGLLLTCGSLFLASIARKLYSN